MAASKTKPTIERQRQRYGTAEPTRVRSVARAIQILQAMASHPDGLSVRDVARELGMAPATVHHLVNTLVDEQMLQKNGLRRYHLGPAVGDLGDAYYEIAQVAGDLVVPLQNLAAVTEETAYICVMRRGEIYILAAEEGSQAVRVAGLRTGRADDAHARAAGKLLLASASSIELERYLASHTLTRRSRNTIVEPARLRTELDKIRVRGYAEDEGEFAEGVCCVAMPIVVAGRTTAAYSLSAPSDRYKRHRQRYRAALAAAVADAVARSTAIPAADELSG